MIRNLIDFFGSVMIIGAVQAGLVFTGIVALNLISGLIV